MMPSCVAVKMRFLADAPVGAAPGSAPLITAPAARRVHSTATLGVQLVPHFSIHAGRNSHYPYNSTWNRIDGRILLHASFPRIGCI
jgi:hypothetical protein